MSSHLLLAWKWKRQRQKCRSFWICHTVTFSLHVITTWEIPSTTTVYSLAHVFAVFEPRWLWLNIQLHPEKLLSWVGGWKVPFSRDSQLGVDRNRPSGRGVSKSWVAWGLPGGLSHSPSNAAAKLRKPFIFSPFPPPYLFKISLCCNQLFQQNPQHVPGIPSANFHMPEGCRGRLWRRQQ